MKKLLTIILLALCYIGYSQEGVVPIEYKAHFKDTIYLDKPMISGVDTITFFMYNDSLHVNVNGDTINIQRGSGGSGSVLTFTQITDSIENTTFTKLSANTLIIEGDTISQSQTVTSITYAQFGDSLTKYGFVSGSSLTADQINDSVSQTGTDADTMFFLGFNTEYGIDTLDADKTIFIDTTGATDGTIIRGFWGNGNFSNNWTFSTNAAQLTEFQDSLERRSDVINICIFLKYGEYVSMRCEQHPYIDANTTPLISNSFEIGNVNDSLIVGIMNQSMTTAVKPQGDWNVTKNFTDTQLTVDTVYSNSDTLKIQLTASVLSTDTLFVDYTQGDTLIYALSNDSILQSFADSSVTNNVSAGGAASTIRNLKYHFLAEDAYFTVTAGPLLDAWVDTVQSISCTNTGGNRPDTATISGFKAVDFEQDNSEFMTSTAHQTNGGSSYDSCYIIAVIKRENQPTGARGDILSKWGSTPNTDLQFRFAYGGSSIDDAWMATNNGSGSSTATFDITPTTNLQIISFLVQGTTAKFFENGTQAGGNQSLANGTIQDVSEELFIVNRPSGTDYFDGAIYEIIYTTSGNETEMQTVITSLKTKYGL